MNKIVLLIILSFILPDIANGQENKSELTLIVKNIRNNKGLVAVQLLDEEEHVIEAMYIGIKDKVASTVFNDVSCGKYAIKIYHDENKNEKMDFNWLGIPKEGCGFSGNPKITFGPPDIKEFLFQLETDRKIIINMVYFL